MSQGQNKKISQFNLATSLTNADVMPIVNGGETKKVTLSGLTSFINSTVSTNSKHWNSNVTRTIDSDSTVVISGNYVLSGTNLTLNSDNLNINVSGIDFNKYAQIFIGGYLFLIDSNIVNNGLISVGGAIIMSGSSTITGSGIII